MENRIKKINVFINIINIYGYISAFYELIINHNIGTGIILTIISFILSFAVYILNNIDNIRDKYNEIINQMNIPLFFKIFIFIHITVWFIVLIAWLNMVGSVFTVIFLGFILYNMPVLFSLITKVLCYILQEDQKKYSNISLIVSLILNIVLLVLFLADMENGSVFYLVLDIIFQYIPFNFAIEISQ